MRIGVVVGFVSTVLKSMAPILLIPVLVGYVYGEPTTTIQPFISAAILSLLIGYALGFAAKSEKATTKEAMVAVALGWILACMVGALPFTSVGMNYLDAVFESVAGFTTTGTTLLLRIQGIPKSVLFWRAFIQWVGGLGIIASFSVFLTGAANKLLPQIFFAETSKIESQQVTQNASTMIKALWVVYLGLTVLEIIALSLLGVGLFDAVTHSFTTVSTGGFSTYAASIAAFNNVGVEAVVVIFMFLGGLNFVVLNNFLKNKRKINFETKLYVGVIVAASALIGADLAFNGASGFQAVRESVFQVVSIMTTTGYTTANFIAWPKLSQMLLVGLMVVGGCAGSTGGGIKVIRFGLLGKLAWREIRKVSLPKLSLNKVKIGSKIVGDETLHAVAALFTLWIALLFVGGAITAAATGYPVFESFSGMASALGNIGPSLIPASEIPLLPDAVKFTYMIGMLAGRLEIIPLLVLLHPSGWKRFP
ncbi:cation transporter [Candidatus Micrarchaeota archaeon CG_4_10_14_0_2_um_filter_55_9]|nr:MAG: hypothetical protein AUJ15_02880 [Candidatus Micrarchaeota archaeon CG1_02_55_41]PIO02773.1 MAG: cation transporter [Candidatus Micrarchaeota archaeon CG09_land_8_20_14_0_10_55_25]PIZ91906.1 MAG: cation transporter [Candidatus Micrarchaeota archaeon CG_4_10_14_0_2_um_filter_55_9]PJD01083.1 MAG: cation transporter [Candidatus Micrarchaeota archaeon CG10_big_fil_rev_8_21_14_0_10_54_18]